MTPRHVALAVNDAGIPEILRRERRWVVWQYETRGDDSTKVPYTATAPDEKASSIDPTTWRTFAEALAAYEDGKCDGVGFVLGDGFVGLDADKHDAPEHVALLNTYTERSPGGNGVHAICRGVKPGPKCRIGTLELYERGRYFTVTGHHVAGTPTTVEERTAELAVLYARLFPNGNGASPHASASPPTLADQTISPSAVRNGYSLAAETTDEALIIQMIGTDVDHGGRVIGLWRGDTSAHGGDHSAADLALCSHLAFWTNYDPARIDRLFRQSGLKRDKWEDREDYRTRTITRAIERTSDTYVPSERPAVTESPTSDRPSETSVKDVTPTLYTFAPAFPADHFVSKWIDHFSQQCDAALEFHEAVALVTLACATSSLTARISGSADGLRTNLFVLLIGDPGRSRKSTAKDYGVQIVKRTLPDILLPEQMTQESFVESLTLCNGGPALWAIDEFTDTLSKIVNTTYLAGMRGLLLELYARADYTYRRVSKGTKKTDDSFSVRNVALSVIGCATPTLFQQLDNAAVGSGLLTRFAIVMPEGKPPRLPQFALGDDMNSNHLVTRLHDISSRCAGKAVVFAPGVLERLDEAIDQPLDESADRCLMTVRMGVMARKVAMLSAAGRLFELESPYLLVTLDDAGAAITVVTRWIAYAQAFEARTEESSFEVKVQKCLAIIKGRTLNRRVIAQRVHVPAKELQEIEKTLEQRDLIEVVTHQPKTGRPSTTWKWVGRDL